MANKKSVLICILILLSVGSANALEYHVTNASEFQATLATAATNGTDDIIMLAAGTYVGNFRYRTSEANALTVKAEDGLAAGDVILDGDQKAYVFMFDAGETAANLVLERVTVQNGRSTNGGGAYIMTTGDVYVNECVVRNNEAISERGHGGGIWISNAVSVVFTSNNISGNSSSGGGGGAFVSSSSVILTSNTINDNSSYNAGGVHVVSSSVTFTSNTIIGNSSSDYGGGVFAYSFSTTFISNTIRENSSRFGGGVRVSARSSSSSATFISNTINGNSSDHGGGGVYFYGLKTIIIQNNQITDNETTNSYSGKGGGAYLEFSTQLDAVNNTIANNISAKDGGGIYIKIPDTTGILNVYNNIIWGNIAQGTGGDIHMEGYGGETSLYNTVLTDMSAQWDHIGGIKTSAPLFFNAAGGDYHLQSNSPCINAGHASAPQQPSDDLDGNPREGLPDIGAYESYTSDTHPADANANWIIDQTEFETYRTSWKNGAPWGQDIFLISPAYVTRAGFVYRSGGAYNNTGANRPVCWTPNQ